MGSTRPPTFARPLPCGAGSMIHQPARLTWGPGRFSYHLVLMLVRVPEARGMEYTTVSPKNHPSHRPTNVHLAISCGFNCSPGPTHRDPGIFSLPSMSSWLQSLIFLILHQNSAACAHAHTTTFSCLSADVPCSGAALSYTCASVEPAPHRPLGIRNSRALLLKEVPPPHPLGTYSPNSRRQQSHGITVPKQGSTCART